jgi:peptidoglycan/LPS O-acetylase OafA/YrhL
MRFVTLDIFRSFGIALVVAAHIAQEVRSPIGGFFGIPGFYWVSLGGVGVTIFLVLSGLSLELRYGRTKLNIKYFFVKRILRIYPVYWTCLILGISIYLLNNYQSKGSFLSSWSGLHPYDFFLTTTGFYAFVGQWGGHSCQQVGLLV